MRRKICLLLLIVAVNQSQGYGIKGVNSGSYSGSFSSASASAQASSFSGSYSSGGHVPNFSGLPASGAYASANANAGDIVGAHGNAGALSGSWSGSNTGAGVNSISGSTAGSYDGGAGSGSNVYVGNYGNVGQGEAIGNKADPIKYTSGTPSSGINFSGNVGGSIEGAKYGSHSGTDKGGCCKGPFPGPNGSIHDYKPAPPGGGGPDPAWLQGGNAAPAYVQQTPHTKPSYTVTSTVTHGTTGLNNHLISSLPGKPGSISDYKPVSAGATSFAGVTYQGIPHGSFSNGCGPSNPDCSKNAPGSEKVAYGSSSTSTSSSGIHGSFANSHPTTTSDIIGKLPGHKGSIYDSKPSIKPIHEDVLLPLPMTTGIGSTSAIPHTPHFSEDTTISPGDSAKHVIGKLPGPNTGIDHSKPAISTSVGSSTTSGSFAGIETSSHVPLIHVVLPTAGGSGKPSTLPPSPSTSYTQGQTFSESGATAISTDLTPPLYNDHKQPEHTKPVYEPSSETSTKVGGSSSTTILVQPTPDTSGTPAYTSKPETPPSQYYQSSNPSQVPVNGICPFGSPDCEKPANVGQEAKVTPGNSIAHPGTGNLPIDGSTAESYGSTGVPIPSGQKPGCSGTACGSSPNINYPGIPAKGCSGPSCGGSSSGGYNGYSGSGAYGSGSTSHAGYATGSVTVQKSHECVGNACIKPTAGCSGAACNNERGDGHPGNYPNVASGGTVPGYINVPVGQTAGCSGAACESAPKKDYPGNSPQGCSGSSCGGSSSGSYNGFSNSGAYNSGSSTQPGFATGSVTVQKSPECVDNACRNPSTGCSGAACNNQPGVGYSGNYPNAATGAPGNGFATGSVHIQNENGQVTGHEKPESYYGNNQPGSYTSGASGENCIGSSCKQGESSTGNGFATGSVHIQKDNGQITSGNDNPGSYYPGQTGNNQPGAYSSGQTAISQPGSHSSGSIDANCIGSSCKQGPTGYTEDKPNESGCSNGECSGAIKGTSNQAASGSYSHQGYQGSGCTSGSCGNNGGASGVSHSGSFPGTHTSSGSYSSSGFGSGALGGSGSGGYSSNGPTHSSGCGNGNCGTGTGASTGSKAGSYSASYASSGSGSGCGSGNCGPLGFGGSFSGSSAYSSAGGGYNFPDFAKHLGGTFSKAFSGAAAGAKSSASSFSSAIASSGASY